MNSNANQKEILGQPIGLYVLFFTEMWERFSYYGMRAILVLYMVSSATSDNPGLGYSNKEALAVYGWYTMLVYLMSIPGGILADKFIGQKKAVLYGGLTLVLGHLILAVTSIWAFYLGLALIILGVGGLKPNISTMVGGLYTKGDQRRDTGFTIFYIGINTGAFLSAIIVGFVGEKIGWHYGFGLAGIGMILGQLTYYFNLKYLKNVGNAPIPSTNDESNTSLSTLFKNLLNSKLHLTITLIGIIASILFSFYIFENIDRYLYAALFTFLFLVAGILMMIYKDIDSIEKDRFMVLLLSFIIIIVFWGAFEQAGGLLNIYTDIKINRVVGSEVIDTIFLGSGLILLILAGYNLYKKNQTYWIYFPIALVVFIVYFTIKNNITDPYEIPTTVFQSINGLFIIIFGTSVAMFWVYWEKKGKENSALFKMAIGTIIMGIGFLFMAKASYDIEHFNDKAALILLILAYLFHTIGELCSSPVSLSFITKVAPVKYVSFMMGVYFAASGLGNKFAGVIGELSQAEPVSISLNKEISTTDSLISYKKYSQASDIRVYTTAYVKDEKMIFIDKAFSNLIKFDSIGQGENKKSSEYVMINYLNKEKATQSSPKTVEIILNYNKDKVSAVKENLEKVDYTNYSGNMMAFDFQDKLEQRTFISIFILTFIFGILLLLLLKKLKKLTHGAEDIKLDSNH